MCDNFSFEDHVYVGVMYTLEISFIVSFILLERPDGRCRRLGLSTITDYRISKMVYRLSRIVSKAPNFRKLSGHCGITLGSLFAYEGGFASLWSHFGATL